MKRLMILTLLSLCLSMLACGNQDKSNLPKTTEAEVKISAEVKSSNNSKGLVDQVSLEKDAFLKQSQLEIKALNKEVGELELKVEKKSGEAKSKLDAQFKNIEQQTTELEQQLSELKAELKTMTKEQWKVLKEGLASAMSTLKKSIQMLKEGLTS